MQPSHQFSALGRCLTLPATILFLSLVPLATKVFSEVLPPSQSTARGELLATAGDQSGLPSHDPFPPVYDPDSPRENSAVEIPINSPPSEEAVSQAKQRMLEFDRLFNKRDPESKGDQVRAEVASPTGPEVLIFDLSSDWSNDSNPNGPWSYNEGENPLPSVAAWQSNAHAFETVQPGWAPSENGNPFLPFWFKSSSMPKFAADWTAGDTVVHTSVAGGAANSAGQGVANVTWTSPTYGSAEIFGALWRARNIGRANEWVIHVRDQPITAGALGSVEFFTRENPFYIDFGLAGVEPLIDISVSPGDVIRLEVRVSSGSTADFVGVEFAIVLSTSSPNFAPSISPIPDQSIPLNHASPEIALAISDFETLANELQLQAVSSNPALVPNDQVQFSGTDGSKTVEVTPLPGIIGTTTITITVTDGGGLTATEAFEVTVSIPDYPPDIAAIPNQIMVKQTWIEIDLTISDAETPPDQLLLSASSSNQELVADSQISFNGGPMSRRLKITSISAATGTATIAVTVADARGNSNVSTFDVVIANGDELQIAIESATDQRKSYVAIPVRASRFYNILSFQFSIHWDPAVLALNGVEQFGLDGLDEARFGINEVETGTLVVSWDDPAGTGFTLLDQSILFALRFELIGSDGASSPILVSGAPVPIEASISDLETIPVVTRAGGLRIRNRFPLSGTIRYYSREDAIGSASIQLTGSMQNMVLTGSGGDYQLHVDSGGKYVIRPDSVTEASSSQGVTALDLALIRRHILRLEQFNSPFQIIAADANQSDSVTTFDIALIRRLVLGISNELPRGLWRFVRSNAVFQDPQQPWHFENSILHDDVHAGMVGGDFLGIKLGDVNGSWTP